MKKSMLLVAVAMLAGAGMTGCNPSAGSNSGDTEKTIIGLVTDVGSINDHSFNEACWKGVQEFVGNHSDSLTAKYKQPANDSTNDRISAVTSLVNDGAKVVVMPGYKFNSTIKSVQETYPNVLFLTVDCDPSDDDNNYAAYEFKNNVTSIKYYEHHSGYFAGYAAVKDGYTGLGFVGGMAVPAVAKYGEGYVAGAEQAAKDMGLADNAIKMNYWYSGSFTPSDAIKTKATSFYSSGTEVIFSCGGGIYSSVLSAAVDANTTLGSKDCKMIGVDVDQSTESELVITSAFKKMQPLVNEYLENAYTNIDYKTGTPVFATDVAGKLIYKGVQDGDIDEGTNAVGLPTETDSWRLTNWTVDEYKAFFKSVKAGTVVIPEIDGTTADPTSVFTGLTKVKLTYVA
ncbi:MAG: BMP family ABC transporter substrate-binding protein [Bacilli bacterium]